MKVRLGDPVAKKKLRVKNLKMFRAKERLRTIDSQQQEMRDTLRTKIESRTKLTESKLEKMMLDKQSHSKSRSKFR